MSDNQIKEILKNSKTIAMIGVSSEKKGEDKKNLKRKPANVVMKYMQDFGYKVYPINPFAVGEIINGEKVYEDIGYKTFKISAKEGLNIGKVKELMRNKVVMFSGHSGVGKSTLVNFIAPGLNLKTSAISNQHKQGIHTTTFAEMFALNDGMKIIDTPGIKGFGVVDMEPAEIGNYFPEFLMLKSKCKFNNCLHKKEPDCAIVSAVDRGEISVSRYESYIQMISGDNIQRN